MKTLRFLAVLGVLASGLCLPASGQITQIIATNTFTNVPVVGETISVNGTTKTWATNFTSTTILRTNTVAGNLTNLLASFALNPVANVAVSALGTNRVIFTGAVGSNLTVTVNTNWALVTYRTNSVSVSYPITVPFLTGTAAWRTNAISNLVNEINSNAPISQPLTIALSNNTLLGTLNGSNSTILGARFNEARLTNSTFLGGLATTLTNVGGILTNGLILNSTNSYTVLTLSRITSSTNVNGVFTGGTFTLATNTTPVITGGEATGLTNINGVLIGGSTTNLTNNFSLITSALLTGSTNSGGVLVGVIGTNLLRAHWTNTTEALATITNLSAALALLHHGNATNLTNFAVLALQASLTNGAALTNGANLIGLNSTNIIGATFLRAANNLSDVTNAAMSRTNLGLAGTSTSLSSNVLDFAVASKFHRTHSSNINYTLQNTTAREFVTLIMSNAGVSIQFIGAALDNTIPTNGIVTVTFGRFGNNVYGSVNTNWPASASFE